MPSFKVNPETNEIGYWTGSELIVLPKSMSYDVKGAQNLIDELSKTQQPPKFENFAPDQRQAIEKLYAATRPQNPAVQAEALGSARKDLLAMSESPEGQRQHQQKLEEARQGIGSLGTRFIETMTNAKELAKTSLEALPAVIGGIGAASLARHQLRKPGVVSNIARRLVTGAGAATGEEIGQLTGLTPESESAKIGAFAGGAAVGPVKARLPSIQNKPLEAARREANAAGLFEKGIEQKAGAKQGYKTVLEGADIDTKAMIGPLDAAITKEAANQQAFSIPGAMQRELSPEEKIRQQLLGEMQRYVQNLGDHLTAYVKLTKPVGLPTGATPKATGAAGLPTPPRTQIPGPGGLESEKAIPSLPPRQAQESSAFGTPSTQANIPKSQAPGKVELKVRMDPTMQASEDIATDIQKLTRAAERAKDKAPDLYNNMRGAIQQLKERLPGFEAATSQYAKYKGYERATQTVREAQHPEARIRTMLDTGDLKNRFTPKEAQAIIRTAERAVGMGPVLSAMLRSPIGRQFLKAGIAPDGKTVSNAVLQLGAQFIARSGIEGASNLIDKVSGD